MATRSPAAVAGLLASAVLGAVASWAVGAGRRARDVGRGPEDTEPHSRTQLDAESSVSAPASDPVTHPPSRAADPEPIAPQETAPDSTMTFLRNAGRFLIPAGFLASLAYYFGWARTRKLYRELGVDHTLLGFSTDDYALRSLGVLVTPLPVVAGYVLALALLFMAAQWWYTRGEISQLWWKSGVVLGSVLLVSVWAAFDGWNDGDWTDTIAFLVISAAIAMLPAHLVLQRNAARDAEQAGDDRERVSSPVALNLLALALVVLFAFSAFEIVRQHALDEGVAAARAAEAHPDRFACVVLVSARPLGLLDVAGDPIDNGDEVFYRYGGLRVFTRASGRLFVWPSDRSPRAGLFIINEVDVVSAQLVPQRQFGPCPSPE